MNHPKLLRMVQCAIFAAILCVFSPMSIPMTPVPLTMAIFAVMLCGVILPWQEGMLSVLIYLLVGLFLPVFSGGTPGVAALPGPTGGYIWSFLLMIPVIRGIGAIPVRQRPLEYLTAFLGCVAATGLCYFCGTVQFSLLAGRSFRDSVAVCVIPFLLPDLIKAVAASLLGVSLRRLLQEPGLLPGANRRGSDFRKGE